MSETQTVQANGTGRRPSDEDLQRRDAVLRYWFGTADLTSTTELAANYELWFGGTPAIDAEIKSQFEADVRAAMRGDYFSWLSDPLSALALIVLLDQFSLNVFRDEPDGFEVSARAVPLAYTTVGRGFDKELPMMARMFIYLPLEHSELLVDQDVSCAWHRAGGVNPEWADEHRNVVAKYGRFPGRNAVYGRASTDAERKYLDDGGVF